MKTNRGLATPRTRNSKPISIRWALVMIAAAIAVGLTSAKAVNTFASSTDIAATNLSQSTTPKSGMPEQTSTAADPTAPVADESGSSTASRAAATPPNDRSSTVALAVNRSPHKAVQSDRSRDAGTTPSLATIPAATTTSARVNGSGVAPNTLIVGGVAGMSDANLPADGGRLTGASVQPGIVMPSGAKFYIPALTLVGGGAAGVELALQNHSRQPVFARLTVTGLPSEIGIAARSISANGELTAVRVGPKSFMIKLEAQTASKTPNLEIQLVARGPVEAGTYQPSITLSGVSS